MVKSLVHDNRVEPRAQLYGIAIAVEVLPQFYESFLGNIFRVIAVAGKSKGHGVGKLLMVFHQFPKCPGVTCRRKANKVRFSVRWHNLLSGNDTREPAGGKMGVGKNRKNWLLE
jgi:hypothetical protein